MGDFLYPSLWKKIIQVGFSPTVVMVKLKWRRLVVLNFSFSQCKMFDGDAWYFQSFLYFLSSTLSFQDSLICFSSLLILSWIIESSEMEAPSISFLNLIIFISFQSYNLMVPHCSHFPTNSISQSEIKSEKFDKKALFIDFLLLALVLCFPLFHFYWNTIGKRLLRITFFCFIEKLILNLLKIFSFNWLILGNLFVKYGTVGMNLWWLVFINEVH